MPAQRAELASIQPLVDLAAEDQAVAPLACLLASVLRAAVDAAWEAGVPRLDAGRPARGVPLLHQVTLTVDPRRVRAVLEDLASVLATSGLDAGPAWRALRSPAFDPPAMIRAAITHTQPPPEDAITRSETDRPALAVLCQLAALPLLQACGRVAASALTAATWESGYCPICAAWPTLAERRGMDRECWLRCGRCAAEWRFDDRRCLFCGAERRRLDYLAPEAERESRRAMICQQCHGYLKTFATFGRLGRSPTSC